MIAKIIRFPYVSYFPIISYVKALGLIRSFIGCMYSLYSHIQSLVVELISYALTVLITERSFSRFHVAAHIYLYSLYRVYGIKGHLLLYHKLFLIASTYIFHFSYDICDINS